MSSSNSDPHTSNDSSDSTEPGDDPTTGVAGENTPDKLTEEIEILQANLVEWKRKWKKLRWNDTHPLPEVQAEVAEKKGQQFTREYAEHMWKQCSSQVVVMVAWKDQNGKVMASMHDFNDDLGPGAAFPDWEG
ncbi:hypothetical protein SCLCIDRAFT_34006 [Scleroderma citrinum Foug A]|uniref:Uncharacterized protein n=1 Tax=Scleroderma citrinum Foug A TaxID=1036808 RepID=A0A0C3CQB0_9AGAM|nr:hypothetical protein SCLCIDRAFT_34006 [Scleroderma citrinum Foug A]